MYSGVNKLNFEVNKVNRQQDMLEHDVFAFKRSLASSCEKALGLGARG